MPSTLEGGCLCKAIRYRVSGHPLGSAVCHCATCRKASAAPAVAWSTFKRGDFKITKGQPAIFHSSAPVIRTFCSHCGTQLTYQHENDRDYIDVTTASLDDPNLFSPTKEIWLDDKISWETTNATLRHFPRGSHS